MKKYQIFIGLLFIFLFVFSNLASASYGPSDSIHLRYPESGMQTVLYERPKYVRYTMYDSANNVLYEIDHNLVYVKDLGFGLGFQWYDEYDMTIPGFPTPGQWKITGRLYSEFLWVIEDPGLIPFETKFDVEEGTLMDNLFSPSYFTWDFGLIGGRISGSLPFHWSLLVIGIVIIIIVIIAIKKYVNISTSTKR